MWLCCIFGTSNSCSFFARFLYSFCAFAIVYLSLLHFHCFCVFLLCFFTACFIFLLPFFLDLLYLLYSFSHQALLCLYLVILMCKVSLFIDGKFVSTHVEKTNSLFYASFSSFFCSYVSLCLSQFQLGTSPPGNPRGLAQKHCPGGRDLTFESCPGAGNLTRAGILWKFKVKHFVRVLVLSVINTGCPKNC